MTELERLLQTIEKVGYAARVDLADTLLSTADEGCVVAVSNEINGGVMPAYLFCYLKTGGNTL